MSDAQQASGTGDNRAKQMFDQVQELLQRANLDVLPDEAFASTHFPALNNLRMCLTSYLAERANGVHDPDSLQGVQNALSQLHPPPPSRPSRKTAVKPKETWALAFEAEYAVTTDFTTFIEKVKHIATTDDPIYARILPIVQSSGVGKSRMLDQAAQEIFTFPMCLRIEQETAYPPGDIEPAAYLCDKSANKASVLLFLKHLLRASLARLSQRRDLSDPSVWRDYLGHQCNRDEFYKEVCDSARAEPQVANQQLTDDVEDLVEALINALPSNLFMIYIDEAHRLYQQESDTAKQQGGATEQHSDMIGQVMSAMADIRHHQGHIMVLTSTNSHLYKLAPAPSPSRPQYSDRWRLVPTSALPQVWTTFPFNVFDRAPPNGISGWTPSYARSFKASAYLGRPLWGAPLRNTNDQRASTAEREAAHLAFTKLALLSNEAVKPDLQTLQAALVCRLCLGIAQTSVGNSFASELVAGRLATALYVEKSRTFMAACYSIDPVLAWAALRIIVGFNTDTILDELTDLTQDGLIERGPRGELITKFAVMRAYDNILGNRFLTDSPADVPSYYERVSAIPHFAAVSLKDFLSSFSGRHDLLDTLDTTDSIPLRQYEGCSTVLAQWIGTHGQEPTVNVDLAVQAILSHCGAQMPLNMPGIDHMLVFCKDENRRIEASNLVIMLFQSKNRSRFEKVKVPQRVVDRFTREGVPVIFVLHEVDSQGRDWGMHRDEKSTVFVKEKEATGQAMGSAQPAPMWRFRMDGVNPQLLGGKERSLHGLIVAQSKPFWGQGDTSNQSILGQLPLLCAEPDVQDRVWSHEKGLFTRPGF